MRFSKYGSAVLLLITLAGCARAPYSGYAHIPAADRATRAVLHAPRYQRELYRCVVDGGFLFKRYHISGVLLFKQFEDGSERAVFQNELGVSFFNFRWAADDSFSVTSIMPQLNRPAVIRTLQTDFELLLRKNLDTSGMYQLSGPGGNIAVVRKNGGHAWFTVDGRSVIYGGRSPVTTIRIDSLGSGDLPQRVHIQHHKAHFTIDLNRIPPDAE